MKIETYKEINTTTDENGNTSTTTVEKTSKMEQSTEPDYIKVYTDMWCSYNRIPLKWRELFLQLAIRMSYANTSTPAESQTVVLYGLITDTITKACGWTDKRTTRQGIKALCDCGAIRRIARATYQINPSYAGRGQWKYNPRLASGGIEDLVTTFRFKDHTVDTRIVWADDGKDSPINQSMREGLGAQPKDQAMLKQTKTAPAPIPPAPAKETGIPESDEIPELAGIM